MMNSSTSSSSPHAEKRRGHWWRQSRDIFGAVAAIALLELGLHVGVSKLGLRNLAAFKMEEGLALRAGTIDMAIETAERSGDLQAALIGSSMLNDIEPEALSKQLDGSPTEKFTLVGANSRGSSLMLENVVLPNLKTDWVVYMVSPHDVNGRSPVEERNVSIPGLDAYAENKFVYKLSRAVETNLYLFRYRRPIVQLLPNAGSIREVMKRRSSAPEPAVEMPYEFATYTEFETASRFWGDLAHIYQLSQENDARLLVLAVPTNPSAEVTYEAFQAGAEDWLESLQAFADERDFVVVDGFELLDSPSQYRDTHHLSEEGARIVTESLSEAIREASEK